MLVNGADLCVNEGQKLSEYRVNLAEEERQKEKSLFLTVSGLVGRRPFWKVRVCFLHVDNDGEA